MKTFKGFFFTFWRKTRHGLWRKAVGLVDSTGSLVVEYNYDAWGRIIGRTGSLVGTLGWLNPFRYRGYVYDEETRMYYLKSRYYNPEWGRFINADILLGKQGALLSHNLFAYCGNNPIATYDPNGKGILTLLILCGVVAISLSGSSKDNVSKYNCYAYALRKTEWQHVGIASGATISDITDVEEVANAVLMDNADRGIRSLSSISDPIAEDEYRIVLRTGCETLNGNLVEDCRFMRQDAEGNWSHKPGKLNIRYLGEGVTPDDVTWDLLYASGRVATKDFYDSDSICFAIQYE